jgi:hypothetical protein
MLYELLLQQKISDDHALQPDQMHTCSTVSTQLKEQEIVWDKHALYRPKAGLQPLEKR